MTGGCYLFPGQSWGVLDNSHENLDFGNVTFVTPALDYEEELQEEEVA